jgi:hypothetical protein
LNSDKWILSDTLNNQWYQKFSISDKPDFNYANIGIVCFYKNGYKAWQAMPATGIVKNDSGIFYQDEMTFYNDSLNIYFVYRNPGLFNPTNNMDTLQIKAVFFDGKYVDSLALVKQIENNFNNN